MSNVIAMTRKALTVRPDELRARRIAAGLTQEQLAEKVGIEQTHLSRLELGGRGASLETAMRLARHLEVNLSDIADVDPDLEVV